MELDTLPLWTRARYGLVRAFDSRVATDLDWHGNYTDGVLEMRFFARRTLLAVEILFLSQHLPRIVRLTYEIGRERHDMDFHVRDSLEEGSHKVTLVPARLLNVDKAEVQFQNPPDDLSINVNLRFAGKERPRDLQLLDMASSYKNLGESRQAISSLRNYEREYSRENANVAYALSECYQGLGEFDQAEESAVQAILHGNFDACVERYQSLQKQRPARELDSFRTLQEQGREWDLGRQHGLVALEKTLEFRLGFDGHYLKKCCEVIAIRRAAAARMLRQLQFLFSATNQALIHTRLRVIHADDQIEDVPLEHFRVVDPESKDVFLTLEDQKAGHWILPDLVAGDVIEWTHHLLCKERRGGEKSVFFVLASPCDEVLPTLDARCDVLAPENWPLRIVTRNTSTELIWNTSEGKDRCTLSESRYIPSKNTGFAFENNYLNPLVACGNRELTWNEFSASALQTNFGDLDVVTKEPALPEPLEAIVCGPGDAWAKLEQAFYWVRDTIKYASFLSGKQQIGAADRAQRIVDAGVGDCNDKTFLLHLVCQRLGIPSDFLLISTNSGLTLEEVPGDQFDHVFLRIPRNDHWHYLDAANPVAVFASAPAWCQGMQGLVLNDTGECHTIALDDPRVNRIEIRESYSEAREDWLQGSFDFYAHGQNGRQMDEKWKVASLMTDDPLQGGQESLGFFLPGSRFRSFELHSHTSTSNLFHLSGTLSRCQLSFMEGSQDRIGTIAWAFPMLPVSLLRNLQFNRLFVFELPMAIEVSVELTGELLSAFVDVSRASALENDFCSVRESVTRDEHSCTIRRSIEIKQRFVDENAIEALPVAFERIERALRLVLAFRPSS